MIITSVQGNITAQDDCDAIVNSANSSMLAGSGVCGVIHKAAGKELEQMTKHLAPLKPPNAVITQAFNLPNKYILHVCTPKFHIDLNPYALLGDSLLNVFRLAEDNNIQRIALPAIGTGIHSFPMPDAINIYSKIALSLRETVLLKEIRFVFQSELDAKSMSTRIQIDQQLI
ncbi:macro domain-containing protein [Candidatus Methylopumilus turicensis]|uniref:Macro domain protein n=1 Tax=Candidatus Methylopumilus turicensis TaxID=1581680 RepID=A0A0B7J1E5_9PROT|nr:macro domain-containing protein [Candidatus Methylopumilus turicensis]CEN56474.1 Macro domain protein [Candidatus Methylopumilus turicensis]